VVAVLTGGHEHVLAVEAGAAVVTSIVYDSRHFTGSLGSVEQRQDGIHRARAKGEGRVDTRPEKEKEQRR